MSIHNYVLLSLLLLQVQVVTSFQYADCAKEEFNIDESNLPDVDPNMAVSESSDPTVEPDGVSGTTYTKTKEITTDTTNYEDKCQAAFAVNPQGLVKCFSDLPCRPSTQWGWTNLIWKTKHKLELRTRTPNCDRTGGEVVADVWVFSWNGHIFVKIDERSGWIVKNWKVWVARFMLPAKNAKYDASVLDSPLFTSMGAYAKTYGCKRPHTYSWVSVYAEVCKKCRDEPNDPVVKVILHDADWWEKSKVKLSGNAISEGMPGWTLDEMETTLHHFPEVYRRPEMQAYFPPQLDVIPAGSRFKVYCPKNCERRACEVIIIHYHCPPCSSDTNGDLPRLLPADGWTPSSCGPKFRFVAEKYSTTAFRKTVSHGKVLVTPKFEKGLTNTAIFVRQGATRCFRLSPASCNNALDECLLDFEDNCYSNWCPPSPPGPLQTCLPCAPTVPL